MEEKPVLEAITRIYAAALSTLTEEELGKVCLETAEQLTQSKFGFIGEIGLNGRLYDMTISDPGWDKCRVTAATGHGRSSLGFQLQGLYGRVIRDGKRFFTNDPAHHPDSIGLPAGHPVLTAFLGVPLLGERGVIGMIGVGNREGGYGQEHLDAISALAGTVVEAFSRKRAEQALKESERRLQQELKTTRILLETADALAEWNDLPSVLHALTHAVVSATTHSRATFALWDEETRKVRTVASSGEEPIPSFVAPLEEFSAPFQAVAETLQPMVADYDVLPKEQKRMADSVNSHLGLLMPLIYRQGLRGGLFVDDPRKRREFPEDEIRLIEAIAAQAAVAIENARLYEEQSSIASTLQRVLMKLPDEVSGIRFSHLYRSATEAAAVGGDFYDMIHLDGGAYILLIGDVSGHGIEAARSATFVRDAVAAFASKGKDPQDLLRDTNNALLRRGVADFVTILLAILSPDRRSISFCSAGHPHMLVRRRNGETMLASMTHHPPLGVFPTWWCNVESLPLRPGDTLLFYTDGVIEARANNELFGESRLIEWLAQNVDVPLGELPSAVLTDVLAFSGGVLKDDVAIMAVEIEA